MSKIESGRFSDLLRRSLGMKGQEIVAAELAPELSPTWELESATNQEWDWAKGVNQYAGAVRIASGAGSSIARLGNPAGSGVLVKVEELQFQNAQNAGDLTVAVFDATALLNLIAVKGRRDTRFTKPSGGANPGVAFFTGGNVAGGAVGVDGLIWNEAVGAVVSTTLAFQIMLTPGNCVTWGTDAQGVSFASAKWYERPLPALEQ